ncbi:hypothetical protein HVPorG_04929 [Roseomonas mucosa]|nr:hypothetical protein HVPorG_04929 [Roseomonas mucosa]
MPVRHHLQSAGHGKPMVLPPSAHHLPQVRPWRFPRGRGGASACPGSDRRVPAKRVASWRGAFPIWPFRPGRLVQALSFGAIPGPRDIRPETAGSCYPAGMCRVPPHITGPCREKEGAESDRGSWREAARGAGPFSPIDPHYRMSI